MTPKKYYPQLDTIRGISVLAVFFYHAYHPTSNGNIFQNIFVFFHDHLGMGLDVFFILSSFLITFLGIKEYQRNGIFSFKNYFIRRVLRIWPLYYLLMFLSFVVLKQIALYFGQHLTLPPPGWYLFFVSNYYTHSHVFFLQFLWTISVEEQFYLIWGICLTLFQKKIKIVIALFITLSIIYNFWGALYDRSIYFHTLTYFFDMMAGAYAAHCVFVNNKIVLYFHKVIGLKSVLFYLFLIPFFILFFYMDKSFTGTMNNVCAVIMKFIFIIYCCCVVIDQMVNEKRILNLSNNKFLIYTGKISYGLYCLHGFVITFCGILLQKLNIGLPSILLALILLLITFVMASLSYRFVEKPFLSLKEKLARV